MENIQLEGRIIEPHYGRKIDTAPKLLERCDKREGFFLSEQKIRLYGIRNFKNAPELANNYWDTSTLLATKGETVKVILPYETGSRTLTEAARFGLSLSNPNEDLTNYGINLDIDGRWEEYCEWNGGDGVYTRQKHEWFEKGKKGVLVGLDSDMTEEQANKCPLLLTKLQHPDYVDFKFKRSADEVAEIIGKTFELGKQEHGYKNMMGQYLPYFNNNGVLNAWHISSLVVGARSYMWADFGNDNGRFVFDMIKKADLTEVRKPGW